MHDVHKNFLENGSVLINNCKSHFNYGKIGRRGRDTELFWNPSSHAVSLLYDFMGTRHIGLLVFHVNRMKNFV